MRKLRVLAQCVGSTALVFVQGMMFKISYVFNVQTSSFTKFQASFTKVSNKSIAITCSSAGGDISFFLLICRVVMLFLFKTKRRKDGEETIVAVILDAIDRG